MTLIVYVCWRTYLQRNKLTGWLIDTHVRMKAREVANLKMKTPLILISYLCNSHIEYGMYNNPKPQITFSNAIAFCKIWVVSIKCSFVLISMRFLMHFHSVAMFEVATELGSQAVFQLFPLTAMPKYGFSQKFSTHQIPWFLRFYFIFWLQCWNTRVYMGGISKKTIVHCQNNYFGDNGDAPCR